MSNHIATFGGIPIPNIVDIDIEKVFVGSVKTTAGGVSRRDTVRFKHTWTIKTGKVTLAEVKPLLDHIEAVASGPDAFWLYEFGDTSNTVQAFAEVPRQKIKPFGRDGWHADGRELTVVIKEQ